MNNFPLVVRKLTNHSLEEQARQVMIDYPKDIALQLITELIIGSCFYDFRTKKIVYDSPAHALEIYDLLQEQKVLDYKWIEGEKWVEGKRRGDIGMLRALTEFATKHAKPYADFWRKTHEFIPANSRAA